MIDGNETMSSNNVGRVFRACHGKNAESERLVFDFPRQWSAINVGGLGLHRDVKVNVLGSTPSPGVDFTKIYH